jgi:hypothetical protein
MKFFEASSSTLHGGHSMARGVVRFGRMSTTKNVAVYDGDFLSWISEKSS